MKFEDIFLSDVPRISQEFGENPEMYAQFGMIGHNGIDFACPTGTPIYATHSGIVTVERKTTGYGFAVRIDNTEVQVIFAHLSKIFVKNGDVINKGDKVGDSGNTGFSTGPHLHYGMREKDKQGVIKNYKNGYFGWVDPRLHLEISDEAIQKWATSLKPVPLCDDENWEKPVAKKEVVRMMNYLEKNIRQF